jgi:hypothetical protein
MTGLKQMACFMVLVFLTAGAYCQMAIGTTPPNFLLKVVNEKSQPAFGATVTLLKDNKQVKVTVTDSTGIARFEHIPDGAYTFSVTYTGYKPHTTETYHFPATVKVVTVTLQPASITLKELSITANKPLVEQKQGKVVVNVAASPTNSGATVLEVLEKSPGVNVDRNGGISLKGKAGVLVTIDDKPTYLTGADLNNLLSSMSSAQVDQIELIANPTAKYDASGNAGVINIKTKKNRVKGFNGSFSTSLGQGRYPKYNNNLVLNYRSGKFNVFFNYNMNLNKYYMDLYALRKYYDPNTGSLVSMLDQPTTFKGTAFNNTMKVGIDYSLNQKTTVGVVLSGISIHRDGKNTATARWLDPAGVLDSAISTTNNATTKFKNGSINLNGRYNISKSQDLAANVDVLHYDIRNDQDFNNQLLVDGGYQELSRASIPTTIDITSGKLDYTLRTANNGTFEAGLKSSHTNTDNSAAYQNFDGTQYVDDNTKSNHFIYDETIHAVYGDFEKKYQRLTLQAGMRYEHTGYHARQLGNAIQKDTAFSRNYGGFFPSGYISYQADTANSFTLTAGRRIDRPAFQTLNPFYFIINKYTYQTGNPYILPQYSWNLELSHQYKNLLTTSVSYSRINNYFSQIFLADTAKGILLYSQGNVGHTYNLGISESVSATPFQWWSLTAMVLFNHKQLAGFNGNNYTSTINQMSFNFTNQLTFAKIYTAEILGTYTTKARNDIQELLYPTGQLSLGLSRPVLKKKATLKLSYRDIFYTNWMEGLTQFPGATEYFKIRRDTRVLTLSFTYRFGKAYKVNKRSDNSAADEMDRVTGG